MNSDCLSALREQDDIETTEGINILLPASLCTILTAARNSGGENTTEEEEDGRRQWNQR